MTSETESKDCELSEEGKKGLLKCFAHYDKSGNGVLELSELPKALAFAGIYATKDGIKEIIKVFDASGDGKLQISELVNNWHALAEHSINGTEMMDAFKTIDKNNDGYIQVPELKRFLTKYGEKWDLHEAEACIKLLQKYNIDGDGKFSYPEFVAMYRHDMYPFKKPEGSTKDITQDYEMLTEEEQRAKKAAASEGATEPSS